jgi:hypothetical protein
MNLKWCKVKFCEFWLSFEGDLRIGDEGFVLVRGEEEVFVLFDE